MILSLDEYLEVRYAPALSESIPGVGIYWGEFHHVCRFYSQLETALSRLRFHRSPAGTVRGDGTRYRTGVIVVRSEAGFPLGKPHSEDWGGRQILLCALRRRQMPGAGSQKS